MTHLRKLATIASCAYLGAAIAQSATDTLEPLPSDPAKRIYYGDEYDPGKYAACRKEWVAQGGDPRVATCLRFKERLPPLDPSARDHFGEFYDPQKYHDCRARARPNETQCNYLKLRRRVLPEYWPYLSVPKPELPKAPNRPVYRPWMSAKQYFDALCKAEAGEFIYRTVTDVDGVYEIRPRGYARPEALYDRYVMEDPYGYTEAEAMNTVTLFVGPKKYRFAEVPIQRERTRLKQLDAKWFGPSIFLRPRREQVVARYFGFDDRDRKTLKKEYDSKLKSRYGYTWRGIKRPKDREHGIAGGELIVVDLKTNEILGLRRGFMRAATSHYSHSGLTWEFGKFCPLLSKRTGIAKDYDASFAFVARELKPGKSVSLGFLDVTLARAATATLEPLPSDPAKRIYYGEHYDPSRYAKCRADWLAQGQDPRVDACQSYKERIPPLDASARDHFGEFYDPAKYHECRKYVRKNDVRCEYLKLRRITQRAVWPYPDVPKPKFPAAPNPPIYKWWMSAKQYFDALCESEAGEFIYRTVDNVGGVYQIRPRARANQYALYDRYVLEDPYGRTQAEEENAPGIFLGPKHYRFFEVPVQRDHVRDKGLDGKYFDSSMFLRPVPADKVARYFAYDGTNRRTLKKEYGPELKSRYGYTWRGIKRSKDREHGIAGGELIVVDLKTNEILGIRRGFIRAGRSRYSHSGLTWETGEVCPKLTDRPGWSKDVDFTVWFVKKVARPRAARDSQR